LTVITIPPGIAFGPTIQSGAGGHGIGISQRYAVCSGYYQFVPIGGDRMTVIAGMYKNGNSIGIGAISVSAPAASWTEFQVTLGYFVGGVPDTCIINVSIIGPSTGTDYHVNSTALVDDITLSGTNAVEPGDLSLPNRFALEQNYPNPFNPTTEIRFQVPAVSPVRLAVYDMLGREVAVLVNDIREAGNHSVTFNAGALSSGMYFCRLQAGGFVRTRSMLLTR
jgi:hypothetical protein